MQYFTGSGRNWLANGADFHSSAFPATRQTADNTHGLAFKPHSTEKTI
jgi:hypothetical protein